MLFVRHRGTKYNFVVVEIFSKEEFCGGKKESTDGSNYMDGIC